MLVRGKTKDIRMIDQEVLTLCNEGESVKEIEDSELIVARITGVNNAIVKK